MDPRLISWLVRYRHHAMGSSHASLLIIIVKVGDTIADIKEGVNAKVCSVGVVLGSNEMALTEAETKAMPAAELEARIADVKERMFAAGASYVILSMEELPALIERMNADR